MSGSVNKVILIGRLGRDPEGRSLQTGGRVVTFSLATDESWRDKATGERKQRTEWHNIVVFNEGLGKIAEQYLKKGARCYLEGTMCTREYTDKDGNQRKATEVVLKAFRGELTLLESSQKPAPDPEGYGSTSTRDYSIARDPAPPSGGGYSGSSGLDDDIPFAMEWR
jgi:single-strand DNA-binding protein